MLREKQILSDLRNSDRHAFQSLFRYYYPRLKAYAATMVDDSVAEDLVQEQAADPSRAQAVLEMLAEYVHRFPEANQRETLLAVARTELSGGLRTATRKLRWKRK